MRKRLQLLAVPPGVVTLIAPLVAPLGTVAIDLRPLFRRRDARVNH
jgi:hypothetical protein